jgi:hypothetical protein
LPNKQVAGEIYLTTGTGLFCPYIIVNGSAADVPPLDVKTVTLAVPILVKFEAGTVAWSCVADTKVVTRLFPFHLTTEDWRKLLPFTVKVKPGAARVSEVGEIEVRMGVGFVLDDP